MLFSFPGVYLPTLRVGGVNCIQGLTDLAANPYEVGVMISVGVTEDTGLSLSMTLHRAARFYAPEARCVVLCRVVGGGGGGEVLSMPEAPHSSRYLWLATN
jgi:hypothetical protein